MNFREYYRLILVEVDRPIFRLDFDDPFPHDHKALIWLQI